MSPEIEAKFGETEDKLRELISEAGRASPQEGVFDASFLKLFQACPYKAYLRYWVGLLYGRVPPLEFGGKMHEALFTWYETGDLEYAKEAFADLPPAEMGDFYHSKENGERLMEEYAARFTEEPWEVLEREVEFVMSMPDGNLFSGRIDQIIEWGGRVYVHDFKTTSQITRTAFEPYASDVQMDGYVHAVRQTLGQCDGVMITFVNKAKNPRQQFARSIPQIRGTRRGDFVEDWLMLMKEIEAEKEIGWTKHRTSCFNFFRQCPYWPICVEKLPREKWDKFFTAQEAKSNEND